MESHAGRSSSLRTASDPRESAAAANGRPQSLSRHALESSENRDLADDRVGVAGPAISVRADKVQTPSITTSDGCQDTATEDALAIYASQSQAGLGTNSNDEDPPLLQKPEAPEDDNTVRPNSFTFMDRGSERHAAVNYAVKFGDAENSRMHFGNVYNNIYHTGDKSYRLTQKLGIDFSLSIHDTHAQGSSSGDVSTFKKRTMYVSKKQQPVSGQVY
jgi:hypothetical protein